MMTTTFNLMILTKVQISNFLRMIILIKFSKKIWKLKATNRLPSETARTSVISLPADFCY